MLQMFAVCVVCSCSITVVWSFDLFCRSSVFVGRGLACGCFTFQHGRLNRNAPREGTVPK